MQTERFALIYIVDDAVADNFFGVQCDSIVRVADSNAEKGGVAVRDAAFLPRLLRFESEVDKPVPQRCETKALCCDQHILGGGRAVDD